MLHLNHLLLELFVPPLQVYILAEDVIHLQGVDFELLIHDSNVFHLMFEGLVFLNQLLHLFIQSAYMILLCSGVLFKFLYNIVLLDDDLRLGAHSMRALFLDRVALDAHRALRAQLVFDGIQVFQLSLEGFFLHHLFSIFFGYEGGLLSSGVLAALL